jgi:hypothetical protein
VNAAGQSLDLDIAGLAYEARLEHAVRQRLSLAEERLARLPLRRRQGFLLVDTVVEGSGNDLALAGTTGAVLAAIRDHQSRAQGGGEHGFVGFDLERLAAGREGYRVHGA